uniref:G protein-coupled receptor n=1 Tax=Ascaris lumbricoides TaxID=6252 RepID=A0A0M3IM31_ASCLU
MNFFMNPIAFNDAIPRLVVGAVFALELFLIAIGIFFCLSAIIVLSRTSQLHINLTIIVCICAAQYLIGGTSRAFIVCKLWIAMRYDAVDLKTSNVISVFYTIRVAMIFIGSYSLPFIVVERIFATYMLNDYETRRRLWIPISLYCIISPLYTASVYFWFNGTIAEIIVVGVILLINTIASLVSV